MVESKIERGKYEENDLELLKRVKSSNDIYFCQELSEAELSAHINFWNEIDENDTTVEHKTLNVGEQFVFSSLVNLSTGCEWSTYVSCDHIVKVESKVSIEEQDPSQQEEITTITGMRQGVVRVSRLLMRSWDEASVIKKRAFFINVVDNFSLLI